MPNRTNTHGNYSASSYLWNDLISILSASPNYSKLTPMERRSLEAIVEKITRICCGDHSFKDHWLDIAGYAQLAIGNAANSKETSKPRQ